MIILISKRKFGASLLRRLYSSYCYFINRGFYLDTMADVKKEDFNYSQDPVRYASIWLSIRNIEDENIPGDIAELGVYRGKTSKIIHNLCPERRMLLFDTFNGFPEDHLEGREDNRFQDTSVSNVLEYIGNTDNIEIRKGLFPDTAKGLESNAFSLIILDMDLYEPTLAGLRFFYPRLSKGGYIHIHDYNSPESSNGCKRAVLEFKREEEILVVEIPDRYGTAIIRKL